MDKRKSKLSLILEEIDLGVDKCTLVNNFCILGVTLTNDLKVKLHINNMCHTCNKLLYVLRTLRSHGMDNISINDVFVATILNWMLYAVNSWRFLASQSDIDHLEIIIKCACKFGYCNNNTPSFLMVVEQCGKKLFKAIVDDNTNILHHLLPSDIAHNHNTRLSGRQHFKLPIIEGVHDQWNFILNCLYNNI